MNKAQALCLSFANATNVRCPDHRAATLPLHIPVEQRHGGETPGIMGEAVLTPVVCKPCQATQVLNLRETYQQGGP